jgi:hypothetical protein
MPRTFFSPFLLLAALLPVCSATPTVALGGGHNLRFVGKQPSGAQEVVLRKFDADQFSAGFSITFWFKQALPAIDPSYLPGYGGAYFSLYPDDPGVEEFQSPLYNAGSANVECEGVIAVEDTLFPSLPPGLMSGGSYASGDVWRHFVLSWSKVSGGRLRVYSDVGLATEVAMDTGQAQYEGVDVAELLAGAGGSGPTRLALAAGYMTDSDLVGGNRCYMRLRLWHQLGAGNCREGLWLRGQPDWSGSELEPCILLRF